jgi:hypothetical protein
LRPLDFKQIEAVVASMIACSDDVRAVLAHRLHAETAGNPLFATEMLASLVDDGRLRPDANGLWRDVTPFDVALPLPITIRDAVRRRLERLSAAALSLLRAGATAEEPWDLAAVGSSAALSAEQLGHATDELVARRFIQEELTQTGVPRYRLSHPVLRRVVLENGFGKHTSKDAVRPRKRGFRPALIATAVTAALAAVALLTQFAFRDRADALPRWRSGSYTITQKPIQPVSRMHYPKCWRPTSRACDRCTS